MGNRLFDKVAVITGSSSGIGRASAERFAEEGAKVVVSASGRRPELGEEIVKGINSRGGEALYVQCDVTKKADIQNLIETTVKKFGKIDILMNNAFTGSCKSVLEQDEDEWDIVMLSTIKAAFLGIKYSLPYMIEQRSGSIINTSSIHGMFGGRGNVPYATAKAGLINMTRQVANDYGPYGIRVNALCPGRIVTEAKVTFLENNPEEYRRQKNVYPLGRPGTMLECANAALFLASDEASFISGVFLPVDGGLTAQLQDQVALRIEEGIREELKEKGINW